MIAKRVAAMAAAVVVAGCATIMSGKTQTVTFNSIPSGAEVYVNGKLIGKTPLTTKLDKPKEETQVRFHKPGYKDLRVTMHKKMDTWLLGNLIFGGLPGTTTDYFSGAMFEYEPDSFQVTLEPEKMSKQDRERFMARAQTIRFILMNYDRLAMEITNGRGEYLDALLTKLKVHDRDAVLADLKNNIASSRKAPAFAEYVVSRYGS